MPIGNDCLTTACRLASVKGVSPQDRTWVLRGKDTASQHRRQGRRFRAPLRLAVARLSRLSTSPARDVWPARSKRRPSVWCYWNRRRQELDRSLGHEDVGSTVVSIPIPSQKGMRRVHDLLRRRVPPLVSIPIPSEKGMRQGPGPENCQELAPNPLVCFRYEP